MLKKYFAAFDTEELYNEFKVSEEFVKPNVSMIEGIKKLFFTKSDKDDTPLFFVNGVKNTDKVITLATGYTYVLEGYHEGQIIVDANSVKPNAWTKIVLKNATIISDEAYGILYNCPESNNKGYQGLTVTLEKDTHNFVVCNKETTVEGDETYASIDSWKDMTIQGVGYLAVYNNIAHGLRAETLNIAGSHIYTDVEHDGIHGKMVNVIDGVFYFQKAKDAFGTTDNGSLNIFKGSFDFVGVTQDRFDSKSTTKLGIYNVAGELPTNMVTLENYYEEGTVKAWTTAADYKADKDKVNYTLIEPTIQTIYDETWYDTTAANYEGNRTVKKTMLNSYDGKTLSLEINKNKETSEDEVIIPEQQMYVISAEYNVIEVSGKITAPIVRPFGEITLDAPVEVNGQLQVQQAYSKKGKLNAGYDNTLDIYLNGAVIVTNGDSPSIANLPDVGRVKVVAVKETINGVINKYNGEGTADHDAIKSENNLPIEVKNEAILYVTSVLGDGVDGGETTFTDSKGTFIATGCGERGVKGNAIVIGPEAVINSSVIEGYITDPTDPEYSTFDGIFVAKGNVVNHNVGQGVATTEDPEMKQTGFADVYARNGKHSKGMFGTTNTELKGVAIIGSLGAAIRLDTGNAHNLYVNQILGEALHPVTPVAEAYTAVPYDDDPIV